MSRFIFFLTLSSFFKLAAQQNSFATVRDGFLGIATDAIAAGQGDIGVATTPDVFSQLWNPSKYIFSNKNFEIGVTQFVANKDEFKDFSQVSLFFYNKPNDHSTYALSARYYEHSVNGFIEFGTFYKTNEVAIDGSYSLQLSNVFSMSVGGRFISLKGAPLIDDSGIEAASSLYGIDVSGFYYGNEIAYRKFNGRWRAGFNFSNLRGKPSNDNKDIEIYAPSNLKVGTGFDFIFNQDNRLSITSEYKMLLDSYTENEKGEKT